MINTLSKIDLSKIGWEGGRSTSIWIMSLNILFFLGGEYPLASLNIADARLKFALRTCMTKTVKANFKGDPLYRSNNWKCQECQVLDTQDHVVRCPVYLNLRTGKDLENDKDLVEYFRKVINIRSKDD